MSESNEKQGSGRHPCEERRRTEEELHYKELLAYFKNLVWALGIFVTIAVTIAGVIFHKDLGQLKNDAASEALKAANRASQEEIDQIFKDDTHLQKFIEATMTTITERRFAAVTNKLAVVEVELDSITNAIALEQTILEHTQKTLADVNQAADISLAIIQAQNDDRKAFDTLLGLTKSVPDKYKHTIIPALRATIDRLSLEDVDFPTRTLVWDNVHLNPATSLFVDFIAVINTNDTLSSLERALIVKGLAEQSRFPINQKLELYKEIIVNTTSLEMLRRTFKIVDADAHLNLNVLGAEMYLRWINGQLITNYSNIIRTNTNDGEVFEKRAIVYKDVGDYQRAFVDMREAIRLETNSIEAKNNFAWWLATCPDSSRRNGREALSLLEPLQEFTNATVWNYAGTIAAAYAEVGDFENAIRFQTKSLMLNGMSDDDRAKANSRLELYKKKQAYHEGKKSEE